MPVRLSPATLRSVRSFEDVLELLSDELDWPITTDQLEEATFDFSPEELGLPSERVPKLDSLRQLRPLTVHQPWGIFFVEFSGPRLPLTPLRRLLQRLVTSKRAGTKQHATWDLDDLLFIITTDGGDAIELHFLAFFESSNGAAEIRSLPWRPDHSPQQYLDRLARELLPHLEWPDDEEDAQGWRQAWRSAFTLRHGEPIRTAQRLAERMAQVASVLRGAIADTITAEHGEGPFSTLLDEVRRELVANVDEPKFADMCAQTLVYGTLTARITDPDGFGASPTLAAVPLSNPFLAAFFEQVHDQVAELDLHDTGLEQLVADLRESKIEAVLDQFGSTAKGGDPVIHFYEEFLKRYDRQMRADAGAFYTPNPVVKFMVAAVDDVMRSVFHLRAGIADISSWASVAERCGFQVPEGVDAAAPFISMIDPATGTGTFLVEWLRRAKESFRLEGSSQNWASYLQRTILPSMHAFELMLAPYSIAHLKVALELHAEGITDALPQIYLTDTLDHEPMEMQLQGMADPVARQGQLASNVKSDGCFTVVLGNPPYDREQRSGGGTTARKGGVVRHGVAGVAPLIEAFLTPLRAEGNAAHHARSLYNDYIYFWRWGVWQALERVPKPGTVAFITASSFVDGISFGGVRQHLRDQFDRLYVIDLGGDATSVTGEQDENVFDIRIPVCICVGVRSSPMRPTNCEVRYLRLAGSRVAKFNALQDLTLASDEFKIVAGAGTRPFTPTREVDEGWMPIAQAMPWSARGIQFSRTWPIAPSRSLAQTRWSALLAAPRDERGDLLRESRDARVDKTYSSFLRQRKLRPLVSLASEDPPDATAQILYRSFDRHWCLADRRLIDMPRPALWRTLGPRQVFLVTLGGAPLGSGPSLIATTLVPDLNAFQGFGGGLIFPLWRDSAAKHPNFTAGLIATLRSALGEVVNPESLLAYAYGLLGTSAMSESALAQGVPMTSPPSLPVTADGSLFARVADFGRELVWLHTFGEWPADLRSRPLPTPSAVETAAVERYPESFDYDAEAMTLRVGGGVYTPVGREVWDFQVSGLKVLQSWLAYRMADRKGKKSSPLDDIRAERWDLSSDLLQLLSVLEHTVQMTRVAEDHLAAVVDSHLIDTSILPEPSDSERKPPRD